MRLRVYTKTELAKLYFPDATQRMAVKHLMRWINGCKPLRDALREQHYSPTMRYFTSRQTALIVEYLGEP